MKAVKQISPRAEQLLSEYSLGHIRAEYREYLVKQVFKEKEILKIWLTAPIAQFPNICVLEALLERIRGEKGLL